jgi:RNA polymerase sigma-70 factor (ECF subfamily)
MNMINSLVDQESTNDELALLRAGGQRALADLLSEYYPRLARMVEFRLDSRLVGRIDPDDVLQEAYIEAARRLREYLAEPSVSFFVWARQITWQVLLAVHRRHLGQRRDARQEVSLYGRRAGATTSFSLMHQLAGQSTSPSMLAIRQERHLMLRATIRGMPRLDREVLTMRHYEQLSNSEVAQILGITTTAASNRYVRALKRLRSSLESHATPQTREGE